MSLPPISRRVNEQEFAHLVGRHRETIAKMRRKGMIEYGRDGRYGVHYLVPDHVTAFHRDVGSDMKTKTPLQKLLSRPISTRKSYYPYEKWMCIFCGEEILNGQLLRAGYMGIRGHEICVRAARELDEMEYECDGTNCPDRAHDHKVLI